MPFASIIVSDEILATLCNRQVDGADIRILDSRDFGDGTWRLEIESGLIPEGSEIMREIFFRSDGSFGFKPYRPDFWEC